MDLPFCQQANKGTVSETSVTFVSSTKEKLLPWQHNTTKKFTEISSFYKVRTIRCHILFVFINAAYSAVQCCSRGNQQTMVVRQNKGAVSLDRTRHDIKWNVCILYTDSCSNPWECVHATNVINHFESRFCQPDNLSCTIVSNKTTILYPLYTAKYSFAVPR